MSKGLGKALASAMKDGEIQAASGKSSRSIFLNPHRRNIFSALTLTPCVGLGQLASVTGVSPSTAEWHLEILIGEDYIAEHRFGRRRIFYPQGLVSADEVEFFFTLNLPRIAHILSRVMEGNGITQTEIVRTGKVSRHTAAGALGELERLGLATIVADGASIRYYPTTLLPDKAAGFYRHSREYSEYMINRLKQQGGWEPEMVKRGLDRIILEAGSPSGRFSLEVGINPYITCRGC